MNEPFCQPTIHSPYSSSAIEFENMILAYGEKEARDKTVTGKVYYFNYIINFLKSSAIFHIFWGHILYPPDISHTPIIKVQ